MKLTHILNGKQLANLELLKELFLLVDQLQEQDETGSISQLFSNKIVASLFYETSTRTRLSFEAAALKLGAKVISMADPKTSAAVKGESLEDTIRVVGGYSDCIILRHPENGAAEKAASVSLVPIINAGDGYNEHPTQALVDLYTMQKELGKIDGIKIAFLADMRYQRNIHSLTSMLGVFKNLKLYLIGPKDLALPDQYKQELRQGGVDFEELASVDAVLPEIDVLYVARVFKERFDSEAEYERLKKSFFIDQKAVSKMKQKSAILHVLPRVYEIDPAVDFDPRAAYFRQAKNGLYLRMALLHKIFS